MHPQEDVKYVAHMWIKMGKKSEKKPDTIVLTVTLLFVLFLVLNRIILKPISEFANFAVFNFSVKK